jgi:hypothetical protein
MISLWGSVAIAAIGLGTGLGVKAWIEASARIAEAESRIMLPLQAQAQAQALIESNATAAARIGTSYAITIALALALILGLMIAYHRLYVAPIVRVGRVPVARSIITDPAYVEQALTLAAYAIDQGRQERQALFTAVGQFGQHLKQIEHVKILRNAPGATEIDEKALGGVIVPDRAIQRPPSLSELATGGMLAPTKPMIAGYVENEPKTIERRMFHNVQVAGKPGSGKTTTIRYLAGAATINGASSMIIDPHAGNEESLATALAPLESFYLAAPASDGTQAMRALEMIMQAGNDRKAGRDTSTSPIALFIDELGAILRWFDPEDQGRFLDQLVTISQEFRKYGIGLTIGGQLPPKGSQGAPLRQSIATVYCHQMHRDQSRLILPANAASLTERLMPGQTVTYLADGSTDVLSIPQATKYDLEIIAGITPPKRHRSAFEAVQEAASVPLQSPKPRSADEQAIISAFSAGEDITQIAKKRNNGSTSGAGYQKALTEINAIIRQGVAA